MKVLTIKNKQGGGGSGDSEAYRPIKRVPMFRIIDIDKYGIYKSDFTNIKYKKGEYAPLWLVGVVAVAGYFAYKKFKK
tara:strand:+ start:6068 stop:6301 length:234 start_codon:yes stop_codon:yes gene_type:complete